MSDLVLPSGTVSFLFTDIEGSTPLWDVNPSGMRDALVDHDRIVRAAIGATGGHIFSTGGDGYGVAFSRAIDAVVAGVTAQQGLANHQWPQDLGLRVRMGVHTGEVEERGGDYFGPPVNRAARLMGSAHGGQLVVSALTAQLLGQDHDLKLIALGEVALKGIIEPVQVFGVSASGFEWLDRPVISTQPTAGNLPRPQTELVGNLASLQERVAALPQAGLVTLTGSGGVGKTRAAIEIGWLVLDEFPDGVWMAELAPIADPDGVIAAVASMLNVQVQRNMTMIEAVIDWCMHRRMLLIVDNCEHVLDPVLGLVTALVAACPTVTVLATSREPLGATGEQVIRVPSLDAERSTELFINRATAADSSFLPTTDDLSAINEICSRLDGIPLAIELAAARTRSVGPTELLARLDDRFRLLRGGGRGGLERHQTLRAAVTWSYQLLSENEKTLFDRISVFAGTFDLAAAESICAGGEVDEFDVIDLVSELVDKSMLIAEPTATGMRYRQLETLRQYGEERLDDRLETAALRDAHLSHYVRLADAAADKIFTRDQVAADRTFVDNWDNLRSAHTWATTLEDLDTAEAINFATAMYASNELVHEHREWTNRTLRLCDKQNDQRASILGTAAMWAYVAADTDLAMQLAERGIACDPDGEYGSACLTWMNLGYFSMGNVQKVVEIADRFRAMDTSSFAPVVRMTIGITMATARGVTGEANDGALLEELAAETQSPQSLAQVAFQRANWAVTKRPPDTGLAIEELGATMELAEIGSRFTLVLAKAAFAACHVYDDSADAVTHTRDALNFAYKARHWHGVSLALRLVTRLCVENRLEAAATLFGHDSGKVMAPLALWPLINTPIETAVAAMPDRELWIACGAKMDGHEIVAYALTQLNLLENPVAQAGGPTAPEPNR